MNGGETMKHQQYDRIAQIGYDEAEERWQNLETGEITTTKTIRKKQYGSTQKFFRLNTAMLMKMLQAVSKNAAVVCSYIMHNIDYDTNICLGTYAEIGADLDMGENAVTKAMVELQKEDYIRYYRNGRWMLNPSLGIACYEHFRAHLIEVYHSLKTYELRKKKEEKAGEQAC